MKSPFAPIEGSPHVELKPAVEPNARWVRVWFGGRVIADSRHALLLRQYGREQMPGYFDGELQPRPTTPWS